MFDGEGCVAMAIALEENSLMAHGHVEGGMRFHGNGIWWDLRFGVELVRHGPVIQVKTGGDYNYCAYIFF